MAKRLEPQKLRMYNAASKTALEEAVRSAALILGLIAGLGHILAGRMLRGLVIFAIFANAINGYLAGSYLWEGGAAGIIRWGSLAAAILIWAYSYTDLVKILRKGDSDVENSGETADG